MYDFKTFRLAAGRHDVDDDERCLLETVAWLAGEPHSDHPRCVCPVLGLFCRPWNDGIVDEARRNELLAPFVFRLIGTRGGDAIARERSWLAFDWLLRTALPAFVGLHSTLAEFAAELRDLPAIGPEGFARTADSVNAARMAVYDLWCGVPREDRGELHVVVVIDLVRPAAVFAARAAAAQVAPASGITACNYAIEAIGAAALMAPVSAVEAVVAELQTSAVELLDRMIRLTELQEIVPQRPAAAVAK